MVAVRSATASPATAAGLATDPLAPAAAGVTENGVRSVRAPGRSTSYAPAARSTAILPDSPGVRCSFSPRIRSAWTTSTSLTGPSPG